MNLEIKKFKKVQEVFQGKENIPNIQKVDIRDYAIFVIKDGTILEKRSILECLKSQIFLKNKILTLKNKKQS